MGSDVISDRRVKGVAWWKSPELKIQSFRAWRSGNADLRHSMFSGAYFVNVASGYLGRKGFVEEREQCFIDGRAQEASSE
jgi:hypothetical protein